MAKRKRSTVAEPQPNGASVAPLPPTMLDAGSGHRKLQRGVRASNAALDPDVSAAVEDGPQALRASPDAGADEAFGEGARVDGGESGTESPLSEVPEDEEFVPQEPLAADKKGGAAGRKRKPKANGRAAPRNRSTVTSKKSAHKSDAHDAGLDADPEASAASDQAGEEAEGENSEAMKAALARPPPVNSSYLPLPWRGRLGYACLNTYLRTSTPPIFCSRTTRLASILEHRHPLTHPSLPEHPTKNRPDKSKSPDPALGQKFVEELCLANVRDMAKLLRWNERYGIRFLRLSSEAFPFASHAAHGYDLSFAADALAEVGRLAARLGHRLTTHPGQFTQLGSPRREVIDASVRDLRYHAQMLGLLRLPPQQDRDAVMVLHMGGTFGSKPETLARFRDNYAALDEGIKRRLVLENDDVCYSVHDLLPLCEELDIPLVLDFHHHNIVFDAGRVREGTEDVRRLFPAIRATWERKGITMKMHYSEPEPGAITARQRRKHRPRVTTLPPCPDDADLMIEAKDKEQAVFELMRTFRLPGWERFNDVVPFARRDDNKVLDRDVAKAERSKKLKVEDVDVSQRIEEGDVGMGGEDGRVYWPPGMEEWLRPKKREVKKKYGEAGEGGMEDGGGDEEVTGSGKKKKLTPTQQKVASAKGKAELAAKRKRARAASKDKENDEVADGVADANPYVKDEEDEEDVTPTGKKAIKSENATNGNAAAKAEASHIEGQKTKAPRKKATSRGGKVKAAKEGINGKAERPKRRKI